MRRLQIWKGSYGFPGRTAAWAKQAEDEGYDGMSVVDSQCLAGDSFVELCAAASATSSLLIGTGVTNPVMRPVATLANAAASLQINSGGRFVLGIGRGDSALAHVGLAPAPVPYFERFVGRLRPLLQGEDIPFDLDVDDLGGRLRPVEDLRLADRPDTIKLRWLPKDYVPAPINVTGTGPKVIAIGARYADQISFAVGADPNRITQAIQFANAQRFAAGLEGKPLLLGIYALVLPIEDRERALALASSGVAASARFSVMHGRVTGIGTDEKQAETLESLHGAYDMNHHAHAGSPQADVITPQFIESFSIIGPPGYCVDRLLELAELGVSRVVVSRGAVGADRETIAESQRAMSTAVLPHLT